MHLVCCLVHEVECALNVESAETSCLNATKAKCCDDGGRSSAVVLDIGAGKALLTRGVYEALGGRVATVALDSRKPNKTDQMYDPPSGAAFTRVVADVRSMTASTLAVLRANGECRDNDASGTGGVVAITKHLCGGATDASLLALCAPPLDSFIGACCFAPCCHQMTKREQYCNMTYLESLGFCQTHVGVRGQIQDVEWKHFRMLISMSKGGLAPGVTEGGEYKSSRLLRMLGKERACELGRHARRLLEEGRMQYLQRHGFETALVRYCEESVTGDNWAIVARKRFVLGDTHPT